VGRPGGLLGLLGRLGRHAGPTLETSTGCLLRASGAPRSGARIASAEIFFCRGSGFSLQRLLLIFTGSRRDCLRVGIEVFWQNFGHLRNRPRLRRCGFLAKIEAKRDCSSCIDASEIMSYAFRGVLFIPCFDQSIPRHDKSSAHKRIQKRSCHILRPPYPEHLHEGALTSPLMTR
jgi:hypothetical protein